MCVYVEILRTQGTRRNKIVTNATVTKREIAPDRCARAHEKLFNENKYKNNGDVYNTFINCFSPTRGAWIRERRAREKKGGTERTIIPISTARVVGLSNQSVAVPGGRK